LRLMFGASVRRDRDPEIFVQDVDDRARGFVAYPGVGLDAGEFVDPVAVAGLLLPDSEEAELVTGAPVVRVLLDRDRDEEERRVTHVGASDRQIAVRGEARHSLRPVDDPDYPIERDGARDLEDPEPASRHQYLPPAAVHHYRTVVKEQHQRLRDPRGATAYAVGLYLDIGSDTQRVHDPGEDRAALAAEPVRGRLYSRTAKLRSRSVARSDT
jgi:hypothetical protein